MISHLIPEISPLDAFCDVVGVVVVAVGVGVGVGIGDSRSWIAQGVALIGFYILLFLTVWC